MFRLQQREEMLHELCVLHKLLFLVRLPQLQLDRRKSELLITAKFLPEGLSGETTTHHLHHEHVCLTPAIFVVKDGYLFIVIDVEGVRCRDAHVEVAHQLLLQLDDFILGHHRLR
jgi:hypothetical protein